VERKVRDIYPSFVGELCSSLEMLATEMPFVTWSPHPRNVGMSIFQLRLILAL
jgi:hypothetical protein